jgi:hypothetical protein
MAKFGLKDIQHILIKMGWRYEDLGAGLVKWVKYEGILSIAEEGGAQWEADVRAAIQIYKDTLNNVKVLDEPIPVEGIDDEKPDWTPYVEGDDISSRNSDAQDHSRRPEAGNLITANLDNPTASEEPGPAPEPQPPADVPGHGPDDNPGTEPATVPFVEDGVLHVPNGNLPIRDIAKIVSEQEVFQVDLENGIDDNIILTIGRFKQLTADGVEQIIGDETDSLTLKGKKWDIEETDDGYTITHGEGVIHAHGMSITAA